MKGAIQGFLHMLTIPSALGQLFTLNNTSDKTVCVLGILPPPYNGKLLVSNSGFV